jgi:hypothetical protein
VLAVGRHERILEELPAELDPARVELEVGRKGLEWILCGRVVGRWQAARELVRATDVLGARRHEDEERSEKHRLRTREHEHCAVAWLGPAAPPRDPSEIAVLAPACRLCEAQRDALRCAMGAPSCAIRPLPPHAPRRRAWQAA